jgi:antitoxin CptB
VDGVETRGAAATGRLRWHCRRGLRELDVLLERYVRDLLPRASRAEQGAFEELLALADPVLAGYLLGGVQPPEPHLRGLVARIRTLCRLSDGSAVFCSESQSVPPC